MLYKLYTYSPLATLVSLLGSLGAVMSAAGAIVLFSRIKDSALFVLPAILLAALALFLYLYVYRKLSDKINADTIDKKLRKDAKFCARFCNDNPGSYDQVAEMNPDFAAQYTQNEKGKYVKIG